MFGKGDQVVVLGLMLAFGITSITVILISFLLVTAFAVGCMGMDLKITALSQDSSLQLNNLLAEVFDKPFFSRLPACALFFTQILT
ncbi:protein of unknown function [Citrobacter amalonaticus]|nr:protein of unknown function [Citrobacter amalonaticus]